MCELYKGDALTLSVVDLNSLGYGVGKAPDGKIVFIAGTVPGDSVNAEIIKVNKRYYVARLTDILSSSPDRVDGFCAAPASCGGCVYRTLSYARELELKRETVRHAFRAAGLPDVTVEEVRTAGRERAYRNKAEYPISEMKGRLYGGFYAPKTHRVVPAAACALLPPVFGEILTATCDFFTARGVRAYDEESGKGLLRHLYLRQSARSENIMVCPVINGKTLPDEEEYVGMLRERFPAVCSVMINQNERKTNLVLGDTYRTVYGKPYLTDTLCGLSFEIAPASFYQVNHDAAELLYRLAAERAELSGRETVLDLYCGAGTIGLSMAHAAGEVIGVEIVPDAVECARRNAERNGIKNASFYCGDAAGTEHLLAAAEATRGAILPDVVLLDPPRRGCDAALLDFLIARRVPKIVYISCAPDTLARDAAYLHAAGYALGAATPVDLFPRTGHVETVCLLSKLHEAKHHINVKVDMDELDLTSAEAKATHTRRSKTGCRRSTDFM